MTSAPQSRHATVAVMQPYFFPYAGYFRLLAAAETFVIFDDVQFPRRGRVHRCEVPGPGGALEWLTLPLARQARDVLIKDLAFAAEARDAFDRRLARLPWLATTRGAWAERVRAHLFGPLDNVATFLETSVKLVAEALDLRPRLLRSSMIGVDRDRKGADRVIAIVRSLGAGVYINAPGGRALYRAADFQRNGLELKFLAPYPGARASVLPALIGGDVAALAQDVRRTARLVEP